MAEKAELIRRDSERTRAELGHTLDALPYEADVPADDERRDGAGRIKDTAERNPLGLALAGAAAGFVAGLFAPATKLENEKLGPISDQIKSQAADVGGEALEHGKHVAQAAAQSALETAKQEGKQHGEELASPVQDKTQEPAPSPR
jgi:gas vesicle protein